MILPPGRLYGIFHHCVAVCLASGVLACLFASATPAAAGEPWVRRVVDDTSRGADGVRLADVNGDGLPDIATGWEEGGVVRVYLHPGKDAVRQPWPAVTVGEVKSPEDAVLADLDGDGAFDVVSCCEGKEQAVFLHWAPSEQKQYLDASAWTTGRLPCTEGVRWMFALPLDVDGQHGLDVIVGSKGENATISWLRAPADPRRLEDWRLEPLCKAGWIMSLKSLDFDGDGDLDVLFSDRKGKTPGIYWLENPGARAAAAGTAWERHSIDVGDRQVMFLAVAPSPPTGDELANSASGKPTFDLVCAVSGGPIRWLQSGADPRQPWRLKEIEMPAGYGTGKGVALGDMNGDGFTDLVFSCENATGTKSGVAWLQLDPAEEHGWKEHPVSGPEGIKFDRLELLDLDGDGDLDILTCEERNQLGVIWYENPLH
ncbi:FG-GAP repeat domain-containing protein [Lignipirellula cremea]|uniref:FG-GAP repeat protein n=1 Tax=Lignipirellula cremea TaxID=2528010 RepID=A0A518DMV9_9BACT|nr:VCBS repeat-containing protein [Lignipirellula cremea]QDU93176.1 FG-GAP repeat protein [Lignipirellula cremea]